MPDYYEAGKIPQVEGEIPPVENRIPPVEVEIPPVGETLFQKEPEGDE